MAETFDGDWLALREPFDAASRSVALAQRLGAALPARARMCAANSTLFDIRLASRTGWNRLAYKTSQHDNS